MRFYQSAVLDVYHMWKQFTQPARQNQTELTKLPLSAGKLGAQFDTGCVATWRALESRVLVYRPKW